MTRDTYRVGDHEFVLSEYTAKRGVDGPIRLMKSRWMLDRYQDVARDHQGGNLVEVGLWDGGSTAFHHLVFRPRALVGFELDPRPLRALDRFLEGSPDRESVHVELGVDQADTTRLCEVIAAHTDGGPLDVVIDDASHMLGPTTTTFECLFPLLRPGGVYMIEDWSHEHHIAHRLREAIESAEIELPQDAFAAKPPTEPLSRLIVDILLLAATGNEMVAEVRVRRGLTEVRHGTAEIEPGSFRVRELIGGFGRRIAPRPGDPETADPVA